MHTGRAPDNRSYRRWRLAPLSILPVLILVAGCSCNFLGAPVGLATPAPPTDSRTLTPTLEPQPTTPPTAAASPTTAATPVASATASATATPTVRPTLPASALDSVCIFVRHQELNEFVSYLEFAMWWAGIDFVDFELVIMGANDDAPVHLQFDATDGRWTGNLGLHGAGPKQIVSLIATYPDGSTEDVTDLLIDHLGTDELDVRFPQEDVFGCD